jgi:NAD(P)H-dependent FMN reductase
MNKSKLAIVVGSIRQKRFADHAAAWIEVLARPRGDSDIEIIDLRDYLLPLFAERLSPAYAPPWRISC